MSNKISKKKRPAWKRALRKTLKRLLPTSPSPERPLEPAAPMDAALPDVEESTTHFAKEEEARRRTGCLSILTFTALVTGLAVLLAGFMIITANDMFALVKDEREAMIVVSEKDSVKDVAAALRKAGIIRYAPLFSLFADVSKMGENIAPGEYTLNASMDYRTLLSSMRKKKAGREVVSVTIREGMTQKEIFALLEKEGVCEAWRLAGAARYYDYSYSFVKNLPYTPTRLEGYLFPDTYQFYLEEDPISVVRKFLANFSRKLTVDMKARAENIGYSIEEIVIIASMIEREAKFDEERPTIASVIYNRLKSSSFPYLQIDATVQYALPEYKEALTAEDLAIDSPYNTYKVRGLPAGPISNPGLAALRAALYPEETGYYYYVARKNGQHYFSKTLAEHNQATAKANSEVIEETPDTPTNIEG